MCEFYLPPIKNLLKLINMLLHLKHDCLRPGSRLLEDMNIYYVGYIVGCRGASQLGGSLLGIPLGYKANKL